MTGLELIETRLLMLGPNSWQDFRESLNGHDQPTPAASLHVLNISTGIS